MLKGRYKEYQMNTTVEPFAGKKALIIGCANERSLAWSIAKHLHDGGAQCGFTYPSPALEKRVRPLAASLHAPIIAPCDVTQDQDIDQLFTTVKETWGTFHILIHSVAFADKENLEGRFVQTSRAGFQKALDISAYSLVALARGAEPLLEPSSSIVTLSYYGAQKVVPNYNVMGVAKAALEASVRYLAYDLGKQKIRVNAISAGPVKTLAAAGIRNFRDILTANEEKNPLRENIHADDVGALAAFLCSDQARHITGTTMMVDSGAHIMAF